MVEEGTPDSDEDPFPHDMEPPELLMEASVRVLAEEGLDGLTLRKVAEKAEKNRGLVHYYFDSKADLIASLLDHVLVETEGLLGIDVTDSPEEQLWTALRFHAYGPGGNDEAGRHYYLAILQLQALAANDAAVRRKFARNHRYMRTVVATILETGIAEGAFDPVDPDAMASFLLTSIDGARNLDIALDETIARETVLDALERHVSAVLLG